MRRFGTSLATTTLTVLALAGFTSGCGSSTNEQSTTKVTHGREIAESEFPSVVLLYMQTAEGASICTGTFVNNYQVVTAAHCVDGLSTTRPSLYYVSPGANGGLSANAQAVSLKRNSRFDISKGVSGSDLAVVSFSPNTAPATSEFASAPPKQDDPLTIVGYGNNETIQTETGIDGQGSGVKRVGTNKVFSIEEGLITFVGTSKASEPSLPVGENSLSGSGDSGGPLFINGRLAGVTSGGGFSTQQDGSRIAVSLYVDLTSAESRAFLATAIGR
jgi:secreted trypsin-like serine protease